MIVNYFILNNSNLETKGIHAMDNESLYHFSNGWHIKAVYSLFIGFVFSSSAIWNPNLMFLQSYAWIIGAVMSSLTFYLLAKK
jgi:NCS1 family nucleobase:cation symporter-1